MSKYLPINLFIRQALLYPLTSPFLPPIDKVEEDYSYAAGRLIGTLEAGAAQGVSKTGQQALFRTGDDGDLEIGYPLTGPRFTDNEDGTVTDNATGLMWVKQPENIGGIWVNGGQPVQWDWNDSIDNCNALSYAGHSDWRLPNIKELISIINYGNYSPAIGEATIGGSGTGAPFLNTKSEDYYSSTTLPYSITRAYIVQFGNGIISYAIKATDDRYVRPVRGPVT